MAKAITQQKVMLPVELGVSARTLEHAHGKAARLIFDFLLAQTGMKYALDDEGFVVVSQAKLDSLGVHSNARRRGLLALQELGLVVIRQEGHGAYHAKLLYQAPRANKAKNSRQPKTARPDPPIDEEAYRLLQAMQDD